MLPSTTPEASSGVRKVAGAKLVGLVEPMPLIGPVDRLGSRAPPLARDGVLLLAVLPLSTLPGGVSDSALVREPLPMMLKPAHSWSAVTMTRVLRSFAAYATAWDTASSNSLFSRNVWAASLACERLSIRAPSTWRKNPFLRPEPVERSSMALLVIATSDGSWAWAEPGLASLDFSTVRFPRLNRPTTLRSLPETPASSVLVATRCMVAVCVGELGSPKLPSTV